MMLKNRLGSLICLAALAFSCQSPTHDADGHSQKTGLDAIDTFDMQTMASSHIEIRVDPLDRSAVAQHICQNSVAQFPNWPRYGALDPWLAPREREAIRIVDAALKSEIPAEQLPHYLATTEFIAKHTTCELVESESQGERALYTFLQKTPIVPVDVLPQITKISSQGLFNAWLAAYETAWHPENVMEHSIELVFRTMGDSFELVSDIEHSYAQPLVRGRELDKLGLALERGDFDAALSARNALCAFEPRWVCARFDERSLAAQGAFAATWQQFLSRVSVTNESMKVVQPPHANAYTALRLTVTNDGPVALHNFVLTTVEAKPQSCVVQSTQTRLGGHPLSVAPGESQEGWCILHEMTMPNTPVRVMWADPASDPK